MHIITTCPRCGKDFMYHRNDTYLSRVTAWDADTNEPCSFEYICQECDEKENLLLSKNSENDTILSSNSN